MLLACRIDSLGFAGQPPLLRDFALTLEAGDWVWLAGPTGCGKSTLLSFLAGLPGAARCQGNVERAQAARLGILLQNVDWHLLLDQVEDELAFGLESQGLSGPVMEEKLDQACSLFELEALRGRSSKQLSSGEKQRVALASLWVMGKNCLLLDEPFAFLDPPGAQRLLTLLERLRQAGTALLVIEHRLLQGRTGQVRRLHFRGDRIEDGEPPQRSQTSLNQGPEGGVVRFRGWGLELRGGQCALLLGHNGCGKTTFFKRWSKLLADPDPPELLEGSVQMVLQQPSRQLLFSRVGDELTTHWLGRIGLQGQQERHPLTLSMGQQRILTLAIALAQSPDLLLLDEPTVGLDFDLQGLFLQLLQEYLHGGGCVICASHDRAFASVCGRKVLRLRRGEPPQAGGSELWEEYCEEADLSL